MEKVSIILPTYNEAENIAGVIGLIKNNHPEWAIFVMDDSSPDGTFKIAENLSKKFDNIFPVKREGERGRGLAGAQGFKLALKYGSDVIVEMDADMSHHPEYLKDLVREAKNFDVVIGSRYIKGGEEEGRSFIRRSISRMANLYLRFLLGFSIYDWTSGYRAFQRAALSSVISDIKSKGPSIVEEVLFKIKEKGFRIKEVPITFFEREKGASKLNYRILFKTLLYPIYMRCQALLS